MNKNEAIKKANKLKKMTGESHSVWKSLSGFEVVSDSYIHTAMGICIYEN